MSHTETDTVPLTFGLLVTTSAAPDRRMGRFAADDVRVAGVVDSLATQAISAFQRSGWLALAEAGVEFTTDHQFVAVHDGVPVLHVAGQVDVAKLPAVEVPERDRASSVWHRDALVEAARVAALLGEGDLDEVALFSATKEASLAVAYFLPYMLRLSADVRVMPDRAHNHYEGWDVATLAAGYERFRSVARSLRSA